MGIIVNIENAYIDDIFRYVVYRIKFPNGKNYIGCTTKSVSVRISAHINIAMNSKVSHYKIYRAINKYCKHVINVEVLAGYLTKEEMFTAERNYIVMYNSYEEGYNSTMGGEGAIGIVLSDQSRENISIAQTKRFSDPEQREINSINTLKWIEDNPEKVKLANKKRTKTIRKLSVRENISKSLKKYYTNNPDSVVKMREGLVKRYSEDEELRMDISESLGGKPILVTDMEGKFINAYSTLSETSRELNLSLGNIGMVISGKRNHTGNYKFKRIERSEYDEIKNSNMVNT
ncbi:putative endonuclease [Bacillus phage vB_BspM_AgentSmith]|nr:putative endonuclease [Bacillus phage vB_BspM_AgentSmith]